MHVFVVQPSDSFISLADGLPLRSKLTITLVPKKDVNAMIIDFQAGPEKRNAVARVNLLLDSQSGRYRAIDMVPMRNMLTVPDLGCHDDLSFLPLDAKAIQLQFRVEEYAYGSIAIVAYLDSKFYLCKAVLHDSSKVRDSAQINMIYVAEGATAHVTEYV
jgi:hypothetical protein